MPMWRGARGVMVKICENPKCGKEFVRQAKAQKKCNKCIIDKLPEIQAKMWRRRR